ncbi:major facilitator superfamily domain-containing protein [Exophiala viscosa]|uniref:Major facilitator superfamily domain-containing protein n=2 Tax=Exophiala viscosa TaxID=2486360 RepID=A0AAN6DZ17_9EURO|nr:major facilitator superfamily domain-containing protein [Exophiala viscosa]
MRALAGLGGAFIMPNAVAMITIANPPGPTRNIYLALFGSSAPVGGWLGAIMLGLFLHYTAYKWFFLTIFLICLVVAAVLSVLVPREVPVNRHGKIDWTGAALIVSVLILFNFSWNQAPSSGWSNPAVIACLVASIVLLGGFLVWEHYVASHPIMPLSIFKAPSFGVLVLVVLVNFMATGVFCWYQVLWLQEVWKWSLLHFALSWTPFVVCAIAATSLAAWLVPRLDAQWILAIGTMSILAACLLMATLSGPHIYWPQVFPSVVFFAFCPDLVYTAAQIIASSSVSRLHQGTAASLISVLNLYGNSLGLGFAGTIEVQSNKHGLDRILGFRAALYFAVGISGLALLVDILFIRSAKDKKSGWEESDLAFLADEELEARATTSGMSRA